MSNFPAIIIPAYTRDVSLRRLLDSLNDAKYPISDIKLIISLDGRASSSVSKVAQDFHFKSGTVEIVMREKNIGLRNHIIWCGDQSEKYGSVIILEDDLKVDTYFYQYTVSAIQFYQDEPNIAGVSLYAPKFNEYTLFPYEAQYNGTSGYFMQTPCSWGQCWTKQQWSEFRKFYTQTTEDDIRNCKKLPSVAKSWPESSWKKYFFLYLVEKNKKIFYPYISYTTNCADRGFHVREETSSFQVPMPAQTRNCENFVFEKYHEDSIVQYDSFMEPIGKDIFSRLGLQKNEVEIDFYGIKPVALLKNKKYCLTTKPVSSFIKHISFRFKPLENNIFSEENKDVALVDVALIESNKLDDNAHLDIEKYIRLFDFLSYNLVFFPLSLRLKLKIRRKLPCLWNIYAFFFPKQAEIFNYYPYPYRWMLVPIIFFFCLSYFLVGT